jgi:hypothetical protein
MKHWMLHCKEVSEKVSAHMDTPLPFGERLKVHIHLLMCKYCMRFYRQLRLIRQYCKMDELPKTDSDSTLSSHTKERMKAVLRQYKDK